MVRARLRPRLLSTALATRQPASIARHAQLRLVDLAARGASYCVRTPSTGRLDLQEGLLRNMQSCLRDVEGTLYVLMDALLELGGMQVTDGLAGFVKRKLGPLHAAALRSQQDRQKPQTLLLQRDSAATAPRIHELSASWVPWLDGMRLRAAGRLEESMVCVWELPARGDRAGPLVRKGSAAPRHLVLPSRRGCSPGGRRRWRWRRWRWWWRWRRCDRSCRKHNCATSLRAPSRNGWRVRRTRMRSLRRSS